MNEEPGASAHGQRGEQACSSARARGATLGALLTRGPGPLLQAASSQQPLSTHPCSGGEPELQPCLELDDPESRHSDCYLPPGSRDSVLSCSALFLWWPPGAILTVSLVFQPLST